MDESTRTRRSTSCSSKTRRTSSAMRETIYDPRPVVKTMTITTNYYPIVVFDLDGTLLRRTTVSMLLAEHLGHSDTFNEFERAFAAGEISNRAIADASAASYAGRTTSEIESILGAASWIDGIDDPLRTLERAGTHVLLATITWRFAAELLQERHGFTAVSGTEL